jgi:citrate synthase
MSGHKRLATVLGHLAAENTQPNGVVNNKTAAGKESVTVTDHRNGKSYDIEVKNGTLQGTKFPGLRIYDPAYMNTASATSRITWIDGPKGILEYRGYPIEQLAEKSTFMEVSYLLLYGELPSQKQLNYFEGRIMKHTFIHEDLKQMMKSFRFNAHPMGMLMTTVAAMGTFHPEANPALAGQDVYMDKKIRNKNIHRVLGTMPTLAAFAYRHRIGRPYENPSPDLSYTENFMYMLDKLNHRDYKPHPKLAKALDVLFILHADHELNCSTSAMRHLASSGVDVYSCLAASIGALYGPRHGGANEAVLRMLEGIGDVSNIPTFIENVKNKKAKLMGFGHRVYKNYDPRARIVRKVANDVFEILGKEPLVEVATALEKIALEDPYFIERKLYPNVDFYSGLIYRAMGFPTDFFPVLFAIPRTVGWLAHWSEFLDDPENKIVRPRQVYLGAKTRAYVPMAQRQEVGGADLESPSTSEARRRNAATR